MASLLPDGLAARVADGAVPGSHAQLTRPEVVRKTHDAIYKGAGPHGHNVTGPKRALASLIDMLAARSPPIAVDAELGPGVLGCYVEAEFRRAYATGSRDLAVTAVSDLRWLRDHCGLRAPDLESDVFMRWAVPAPTSAGTFREPSPAGNLPLRLLCALEDAATRAFATAAASGVAPAPLAVYLGSIVVCTMAGRRIKEGRTATLLPARVTPAGSLMGSYHPKGAPEAPRRQFRIPVWGVLGPFAWLTAWRGALESVQAATLFPALDTGSILSATAVRPWVPREGDPGKWVGEILSTPWIVQITDVELLASLRLRGHTLHGSLNEAIFILGTPLGFDLAADPLAVGGWKPSAQQRAAAGPSSVMAPHYAASTGSDTTRVGVTASQLDAVTRVISFARALLAGHDWRLLPVREEELGWGLARDWGLAHVRAGRTLPLPLEHPARTFISDWQLARAPRGGAQGLLALRGPAAARDAQPAARPVILAHAVAPDA